MECEDVAQVECEDGALVRPEDGARWSARMAHPVRPEDGALVSAGGQGTQWERRAELRCPCVEQFAS
ncbi:MAG TPA: hypothetical protein VFO44_12665 [Steroidobacteraceae bacterium]|nr:hypothetical protein [Steroidobacteraceae bacterium]